jgi:ABC-type Zn uptake system ZnuABC Zn-binding protein ZnuA
VTLCEQIESEKPDNADALLALTHAATEEINALEDEFDENESELETEAREVMAADFDYIVRAYGFTDVDIEDVIAPREW